MRIPYETFEHEADIGIRGYGRTVEEAFANAAMAMYSVMLDISRVKPQEERIITVSAPDIELLLVEWLNALLAISDIERLVFSDLEVKIQGNTLTGKAMGEPLDRERHEANVEVKAATLHMLKVEKIDGGYKAECVVDV